MRYLIQSNHTLLVKGPASFQIRSGEASVLAAPLELKKKVVVRQEKQLPIEAKTEVDLEVVLGEAAEVFEIEGSTIPKSWSSAADALVEMRHGKVMVIGATDVGKSTFCAYSINQLMKKHQTPQLIDADIGQTDVGPPTTIGRATPPAFVPSLLDLKPEALIFIGHTSPSQVENKIVQGIQRLSENGQSSLMIINTDGWVLDPAAIFYKVKLIDAIEPDVVVGIAASTELQPILSGSRARSMLIEAPQEVLARSRGDRRQIRFIGYRRFLEGGSTRTFNLSSVKLTLPKGFPPPQGPELKNAIVGLLNEQRYLVQIGVLMNSEKAVLRVYSRPAEGVREIEIGHVKLSTDGEELGYIEL